MSSIIAASSSAAALFWTLCAVRIAILEDGALAFYVVAGLAAIAFSVMVTAILEAS